MPHFAANTRPRCAVVDLGSNSVRLVVFEGLDRNPTLIFNEKAVLRLGRGLQDTGRLNADGVAQALMVMTRYAAIARAMRAAPFEVLATAAVRDASNGPAFVDDLRARMPGVPIRILSGGQEAGLSADGLLCGIPDADGLLADIGGGSLELVHLESGARGIARTLPLGVIRLADRAQGDVERARLVADADLDAVPNLGDIAGRDLYLVGGAWRALARVHMAQSGYPLNMIQAYTLTPQAARELASAVAGSPRRILRRWRECRAGGWRTCLTPPSCCAACYVPPEQGAWCSARWACERGGTCNAFPNRRARKTRCSRRRKAFRGGWAAIRRCPRR